MSIGGHQSSRSKSDAWFTPPFIFQALGAFDLDPCTLANRPWDIAKRHLTEVEDGLKKPWKGRVWLNPPYDRHIETWMRKMADHRNGIALVFARTETQWFVNQVWNRAQGVMFLYGRLHFHYPNGAKVVANSGAPSCLVAYGWDNFLSLAKSGLSGRLVQW